MTASRLLDTLKFLNDAENKFKIQPRLEQLASAFSGLVSSSTQASQTALANALTQNENAFSELQNIMTPMLWSALEEIGAKQYYDLSIPRSIRESFAANGMTPTVTESLTRESATQRAAALADLKATMAGLQKLGVAPKALSPGLAEMTVVLPKQIFSLQLGLMAKELAFLNRLLRHVSEAVLGRVEPVIVEELSSSEPTFALVGAVGLILAIGKIVNSYLDAATKALKLRELVAQSREAGVKRQTVERLSEQIEETIAEAVENAVEQLKPVTSDTGRAAELAIALKIDVERLFQLFEHGLTIEIRASDEPAATDEAPEALQARDEIRKIGKVIQFPKTELPVLSLSPPLPDEDGPVSGFEDKPHKSKPGKKRGITGPEHAE